jgi:hypothetical protein
VRVVALAAILAVCASREQKFRNTFLVEYRGRVRVSVVGVARFGTSRAGSLHGMRSVRIVGCGASLRRGARQTPVRDGGRTGFGRQAGRVAQLFHW